MSTTWEQLEGAALSLARAGAIKDRLVAAVCRSTTAQLIGHAASSPGAPVSPAMAAGTSSSGDRPT